MVVGVAGVGDEEDKHLRIGAAEPAGRTIASLRSRNAFQICNNGVMMAIEDVIVNSRHEWSVVVGVARLHICFSVDQQAADFNMASGSCRMQSGATTRTKTN